MIYCTHIAYNANIRYITFIFFTSFIDLFTYRKKIRNRWLPHVSRRALSYCCHFECCCNELCTAVHSLHASHWCFLPCSWACVPNPIPKAGFWWIGIDIQNIILKFQIYSHRISFGKKHIKNLFSVDSWIFSVCFFCSTKNEYMRTCLW